MEGSDPNKDETNNPKKSHRRTTSSVTNENSVKMKPELEESEEVAIKLDKAFKAYGSRKHKHPVLMGLDMEVGKGHIYGLLGKAYKLSSLVTLLKKVCRAGKTFSFIMKLPRSLRVPRFFFSTEKSILL